MKTFLNKLSIALFIFAFAFTGIIITSCEGPEGDPGKDGIDGTDGKDAASGCVDCHGPSTMLLSRTLQWAASQHAIGSSFERSTASCAGCHTSDGFREIIETGAAQPAGNIENPTGQNCRTCHTIHENYNDTDWQLTTVAPVKLAINGETVDFGMGNLCTNCHQPRVPSPMPVKGGPDVTIGNFRWGTHYGTQAVVLGATGAYEIEGSTAYASTNAHKNVANGCVSCHMGKAFGTQAGGHTMKMVYNETSDNVAVCTDCHEGITSFNFSNIKEEYEELFGELSDLLTEKGMIDDRPYPIAGKTYSPDEAGVLLNWVIFKYDQSHMIHNPRYSRAVLKNSIEYLKNN